MTNVSPSHSIVLKYQSEPLVAPNRAKVSNTGIFGEGLASKVQLDPIFYEERQVVF